MSIHLVNETTIVNVSRRRLTKNLRIENIHEMKSGENLSFDFHFDRNVYTLNIRVQSVANVPDQLCIDINNHENNVKRSVEIEVIFKNTSDFTVFQKKDVVKPTDTPFSPLVIGTKRSFRDFPQGYLLVTFHLNCISWTAKADLSNESEKSTLSSIENLSRDFGQLFTGKQNADVSVHVGKAKIAAHSLILSARSKVFAAMFAHDMSEKKDRIIEIDDINALPMHYFLNYLYTGELKVKDLEQDTLKGVYTAADKYEVLDLKEMCADFMLSKLSLDNVATCAEVGFRHGDKRMQDSVIDLMSKHKQMIPTVRWWQDLEDSAPDVAVEVLDIIRTKD